MTTGIMDFDTDGRITGEPLPYGEVKEDGAYLSMKRDLLSCAYQWCRSCGGLGESGSRQCEHGNYVTEETLQMMAESDIVWVPTITVVPNMFGCGRFSDELLHEIYVEGEEGTSGGH